LELICQGHIRVMAKQQLLTCRNRKNPWLRASSSSSSLSTLLLLFIIMSSGVVKVRVHVIQVFTLTVMSADRYLAVCRAIESRRYRTPCYSRAVCVAVWVASLLVMMPIYLYSKYALCYNVFGNA